MARMHTMLSMELDDEDKLDACMPVPCDKPDYPYGLRICLCTPELKKLRIDPEAAEIGGIFHGHFLARVTSISKNRNEQKGEDEWRIEAQIEDLDIECEDDEDED